MTARALSRRAPADFAPDIRGINLVSGFSKTTYQSMVPASVFGQVSLSIPSPFSSFPLFTLS